MKRWPTDKIKVVLAAMPSPGALALANNVLCCNVEAPKREDHGSDRNDRWRFRPSSAAATAPHHRRQNAAPRPDGLQLRLEPVSQLHDGFPLKIRPPFGAQERYQLGVPDLAALSRRHSFLPVIVAASRLANVQRSPAAVS
jgi:hypothetical protein